MAMNIISILLIILIAMIIVRIEQKSRLFRLTILALIILLLYFSITGVISSKGLSADSPKGIFQIMVAYISWVVQTLVKLWDIGVDTVRAVGNAIAIGNA